MSERDERVSALVEWLNEQGAAAGSSIHGWRCEYPDRYGECDCVAEMARDLLDSPAMRDLLAEAWDEGWLAAQEVVDLDGIKCWAHTVYPRHYDGNPYRQEAR